jgi:protein-tyrosine phosphatase
MANRARSALAELITRDRLAAHGLAEAIPVSGAGTWTRGGEPIWPAAGEEARRRGLDPSAFRSHRLSEDLVRDADLVLAATRALRDEVITLAPFALRRTFTWLELAWLLDGVDPHAVPGTTPLERLRALPALAATRRGHLAAPSGSSFDVADPVNRDAAYMSEAANQISGAVDRLVGVVAGQATERRSAP